MGTNSRSFSIGVKNAGKRITEEQLPTAIVRIGFDALGRIVRKTPVDTGRLRGSIQADLNRLPSGEGTPDKTGVKAQAAARTKIAGYKLGDTVFIGTNVEYAQYIEGGRRLVPIKKNDSIGPRGKFIGSKQAPKGMFGITAAELRRAYPGILR